MSDKSHPQGLDNHYVVLRRQVKGISSILFRVYLNRLTYSIHRLTISRTIELLERSSDRTRSTLAIFRAIFLVMFQLTYWLNIWRFCSLVCGRSLPRAITQVTRPTNCFDYSLFNRSHSSWHSGHFHFGSLVQCPDEIWHNSAGIPAVPFKEPLPAYSPSTQLSSGNRCPQMVEQGTEKYTGPNFADWYHLDSIKQSFQCPIKSPISKTAPIGAKTHVWPIDGSAQWLTNKRSLLSHIQAKTWYVFWLTAGY
jgi:hypothetical protein